MEIARLTAICRKTDCGPLENEVVRLRAQIRTPEAEEADVQAEKSDQAAKHDKQHDGDYKGIWGLYNEGLDEDMQQYQQIIELECENENLKEQVLAAMTAGSGDEMSEEEQADQQAKQ
jgi:hypothetical protein